MIENFIHINIKSSTKEEALVITVNEKNKVISELKVMGCDILNSEQKSSLLNSEGLTFWHYYHDLFWLENILNGNSIVYVDRMKLHDKLKDVLVANNLI